MNLGTTIQDIRKQKGISQKAFAELCNLSQTYLSQIENNQKEPAISTLKEIALRLKIPLPILFFLSLDEKDIPKSKRNAFNIIDPTVKILMHEFIENENN
jgi:transcriptional regulator with XRE-family HTH domain